jgi:UDP-2,4-diacetamido-2,4,6-trideoxy-beta-L-altropyranose hydrolase
VFAPHQWRVDSPRLLFVVDAGPEIGGGHVMRSLTLARALAARGARPAFRAPPDVARLLDVFAPDMARAEDADAFDAVVFDSYRLGAADHAAIAQSRPVLVIDDLADRPLHADLVLDLGPDRRAEDYTGLTDAQLLLGPSYGLVRPEFAALRETALARRGDEVARVLISMGLTDVGGVTARLVNRILPRLGAAALDVVLGAQAPSLGAMTRLAERDPRVIVHVETREMAALTCAADLAVGAGGGATWERCAVGLPTLLVVLADNQAPAAEALAAQGAIEPADARRDDFEASFDRAFTSLMRSPERRAKLSERSAAVCDGQGADRVAQIFLKTIMTASGRPAS